MDRLTTRTVSVVRLPVLVDTALEAAIESIDLSRHDLDRQCGDVVVNATPGHVERILRGLVHNAVKYAPAGSTITVAARRRGEATELRVDDEGPGVPSDHRISVFEPLWGAEDAGGAGLGLGLALVKRFAELHGGRAWVEDAPGGGASFRVLLPDEGEPVAIDHWTLPTHVDGAAVAP